MAGPFDPFDQYADSKAVDLAEFAYTNQNAQRNLEVKSELAQAVREAVPAVYGPDYRVEVMSGAQGEGSRGMTGSRRHTTGVAADVWVYSPDGKRLKGDDLVPLSQHWLGNKVGSVGFPAKATSSLHLDLVGGTGPGAVPRGKGEGSLWYYGTPTKEQRSALNSGALPTYAIPLDTVRKGLVPPAGMASDPAPRPATTPQRIQDARLAYAGGGKSDIGEGSSQDMLIRMLQGQGAPVPAPRLSRETPSLSNAYDSPRTAQQVASLYEGILPRSSTPAPRMSGIGSMPDRASVAGFMSPQSIIPRLSGDRVGMAGNVPYTLANPGTSVSGGLGSLVGNRAVSPSTPNPAPRPTTSAPGAGVSQSMMQAMRAVPVAPKAPAPSYAVGGANQAGTTQLPRNVVPAAATAGLQLANAGVAAIPRAPTPLSAPTLSSQAMMQAMRATPAEMAKPVTPRVAAPIPMPAAARPAPMVAPQPATMSAGLRAPVRAPTPAPVSQRPSSAQTYLASIAPQPATMSQGMQQLYRAGNYTYEKTPNGYVKVGSASVPSSSGGGGSGGGGSWFDAVSSGQQYAT